jgi:hypothetical protein
MPLSGCFIPKKTRYLLHRRRGGGGVAQGWSGQVLKISPPPGFNPQTFQPVASHCTDWAIPALNIMLSCINVTVCLPLRVLTRIWCWSLHFVVIVKYYGLMGSTVASFLGDSGSNLGPAILTEDFSGCPKAIPADARTQSEIDQQLYTLHPMLCCIHTYLLTPWLYGICS